MSILQRQVQFVCKWEYVSINYTYYWHFWVKWSVSLLNCAQEATKYLPFNEKRIGRHTCFETGPTHLSAWWNAGAQKTTANFQGPHCFCPFTHKCVSGDRVVISYTEGEEVKGGSSCQTERMDTKISHKWPMGDEGREERKECTDLQFGHLISHWLTEDR